MKLGVLGGSGLYDMKELKAVRRRRIKTPFGDPSDAFVCGCLGETEIVFLPRHGIGHRLLPSEINHKANICGMKMLGVERVLSISAVGSLKEEYRPGDIVLPDQYFDRTKASDRHTFFGNGVVAHVSFGEPTCSELGKWVARIARDYISRESKNKDVRVIDGGVYVNMEGPAFSTRAESEFHRKMGFDIVGMTSLAEAKLCREAELCYQAMALVTDYDCWHATEEDVSVEALTVVLNSNVEMAREIIMRLASGPAAETGCGCRDSLKTALITNPACIPAATKRRMKPIIGKYLK